MTPRVLEGVKEWTFSEWTLYAYEYEDGTTWQTDGGRWVTLENQSGDVVIYPGTYGAYTTGKMHRYVDELNKAMLVAPEFERIIDEYGG